MRVNFRDQFVGEYLAPYPYSLRNARIRKALTEHNLMDAYLARPPYQRNDYIGWITRAKQEAPQEKRLTQMLDELEKGGVYKRMKRHPK